MKINHNYSKLWQLYGQAQSAKFQNIDPVEIFNSRLHDKFMHIQINGADLSGFYSRNGTITVPAQEITDAITDAVNFGNVKCPGGWPTDLYDEFYASCAFLPPVSPERAIELKAVNNHINFQSGVYYKFTDESGKTRILGSNERYLFELETDKLAGRVDGETEKLADFWSSMYYHAPWGRERVSPSKQTEYLEAAGVQPGFFTFTANDRTVEFYFNPECKGYPLMGKIEYDSYWNAFQADDWGKYFCKPGDILESSNGRQFIVNSDNKIDVQYGEDLLSLHDLKIIGHIDI